MSRSPHGHSAPKVSYPTREAAVEAATRRRADGFALVPYPCRVVRPGSLHPVLHAPHCFHEAWNDELGVRAAGCACSPRTTHGTATTSGSTLS